MIRIFRVNANRSSIQTKLNSFLSVKEDMYLTLKQLYELELLFNNLGLLKYVFVYPSLFLYISITLGILMNIFILVGYTTDDNPPGENVYSNIKLFFVLDKDGKYNLYNTN